MTVSASRSRRPRTHERSGPSAPPKYGDRPCVIVGQGSPSSWRVKFDERVTVQAIHEDYLECAGCGEKPKGEAAFPAWPRRALVTHFRTLATHRHGRRTRSAGRLWLLAISTLVLAGCSTVPRTPYSAAEAETRGF